MDQDNKTNNGQQNPQQNAPHDSVQNAMNMVNNTADYTSQYSPEDINNNKVMAVLAYFWILFLVPMFAAKDSPYARFHTNQGLLLFLFNIAVNVLSFIIGMVFGALRLGGIAVIIGYILWAVQIAMFIIGVVHAAKGEAKELPIIGKYRLYN